MSNFDRFMLGVIFWLVIAHTIINPLIKLIFGL